jgi:hypothetical protein
MRKLGRTKQRKVPPVLIVRPHRDDNRTQQQTSAYITRAIVRGIAECQPFPSKAPELARNYAIADFLENHPRKTHIFFQDDDSTPKDIYTIEKLLRHNKPVICGVTPIWRYGKSLINFQLLWSPVIRKDDGKLDNIGVDELPKKPFKAYRTGGTCMLIARRVLEKLEPPYQKTTFNDTVTDVTLSEDMYFSDKIRNAGFEIWIDPQVICSHFHVLDILDVFSVYNTAIRKLANR